MREETNLDIFSFRNQGTQPKYHDVYPELEARLFQGALDDQVAIVTGAGRGIGRSMSLALANAGCSLFLVARTRGEIEKVAKEVQKLHPSIKAIAHVTDLNETDQLEDLVSAAIEAFGHIDLLVNNAALGTTGPFDTYCMDKWWKMHTVNVRAPVVLTSLVLPHMTAAGKGRIINIVSEAAIAHPMYMSAYSSSKAALIEFTTSLQQELNTGPIHAFALHPGAVAGTKLMDLKSMKSGEIDPRVAEALNFDANLIKSIWPDAAELGSQTVVYIATGKADSLAGHYISANDNITEVVARSDEIKKNALYKLTIRQLDPK